MQSRTVASFADNEPVLSSLTEDKMSKIVLVDDESAITNNLAPFLERTGFDVEVAVDGADALSKAASFAPDLIVSDVLMPRAPGRTPRWQQHSDFRVAA
jgi:DNA-binding response OmpR family regulator